MFEHQGHESEQSVSITAQSTNCENHMADQDHVTHTTGGTEGRGPTNCYLTHLLYMGEKLKDSS